MQFKIINTWKLPQERIAETARELLLPWDLSGMKGSKGTTRKGFTTSALSHTRTPALQGPVDPTQPSYIWYQVKPDWIKPDKYENFNLSHITAVPATHSLSILFFISYLHIFNFHSCIHASWLFWVCLYIAQLECRTVVYVSPPRYHKTYFLTLFSFISLLFFSLCVFFLLSFLSQPPFSSWLQPSKNLIISKILWIWS